MKYLLTLIAFILSVSFTFAKEGMWIPTLLEAVEDDMQAFGCELSAEEIYSINQSSLKDAIVHFNGGCTAEVISADGLLLTNHHCGYSQIQSHSSLENDYLKNGFWAYERDQELANPGVTATFIEEIMDVTQELIAKANDPEAFKKAQEALIEKRIKDTNLAAVIRAFNYGNSYFMIVTKEYKDVRLVGAPPSAVGKFGGDTDNWVWPRHTGDFSMFRIYAGADNEPAEYSESNQPLKAKRHLEINLNGVKEGDFTMVFGFPGRTEQHLLATEVDYVVNKVNPMRLEMREASLNIIDNAMRNSDKTRIQYAAKQSRISNAYKKWIGQNQGLRELGAVQIKKEEENAFVGLSQAKQDQKSIENLTRMNALVLANQEYQMAREGFIEYFYYGPEIVRFSSRFANLIENYDALKEKGSLDATIDGLIAATNG
ncbi:MAG: S46 family peptidase, partial [Flavobacteriales bacterium]